MASRHLAAAWLSRRAYFSPPPLLLPTTARSLASHTAHNAHGARHTQRRAARSSQPTLAAMPDLVLPGALHHAHVHLDKCYLLDACCSLGDGCVRGKAEQRR